MINKEIIHKYLTGKCTDEEVQEVFYYLKQNPSEIEKYLPRGVGGHGYSRT